MSIDQTKTATVPPALRARPKHAETRGLAAKRFAGGAVLSAAIAGGAFAAGPLAGLAGLDGVNVGSTGTAQAAPCVTGLFCDLVNGGDALFGGGIGLATGTATALTAPFGAILPLNLIGPGGILIGDGLDAPATATAEASPATAVTAACSSAAAARALTPRLTTPPVRAATAA